MNAYEYIDDVDTDNLNQYVSSSKGIGKRYIKKEDYDFYTPEQETYNEGKNKLSIIKKVKADKLKSKLNITNKSINNEKIAFNNFDDYFLKNKGTNILSSNSILSPKNISRQGLNDYLYKQHMKNKQNKKWYDNYKHNSNENSMLEEYREEIYIPSDKTLSQNKQKDILFKKALELKENVSNQKGNEWFIENMYKSILDKFNIKEKTN